MISLHTVFRMGLDLVQSTTYYRQCTRHLRPPLYITASSGLPLTLPANAHADGGHQDLFPGSSDTLFISARTPRGIAGWLEVVHYAPSHTRPSSVFWLHNLRVLHCYRRMGIGEHLCRVAIRQVQARPQADVFLIVRRRNDRARCLYTQLGFQPSIVPQHQRPLSSEYMILWLYRPDSLFLEADSESTSQPEP